MISKWTFHVGLAAIRLKPQTRLAYLTAMMCFAVASANAAWTQTKLTASDGAKAYSFGSSATISSDGSTALVGSPGVPDGSIDQVGAAYLFKRSGLSWLETELRPSDGTLRAWFGSQVALSADGNIALVGSPGDPGFPLPGYAYVYRWNGSQWVETKLETTDPNDHFATSVSLSADGTRAALGSPYYDNRRGAAYIYNWDGTQWLPTRITASDGVANNDFGGSVHLSGDGKTLIVGSRQDSAKGFFQGSAYIFELLAGVWVQQKKLTASDALDSDEFGASVGLNHDGTRAIVGSPLHPFSTQQGQAYVYELNAGQWVETKIAASDGGAKDWFGSSVSFSGDGESVLVGSPAPDLFVTPRPGSAYLYRRMGLSSWTETKLAASDGAAEDFFGAGVGLDSDGRVAIAGAPNLTVDSDVARGAAYIFVSPTDTSVAVDPASGQYSDLVTLKAAVSPATATGSIEFFLDGSSAGTSSVDSTGAAEKTVQILLPAGNHTVSAQFTSDSPFFSDSTGGAALTVTREDAVVTPLASNPSAVKANVTGGTAGPITLCATITEVSDGSLGDIGLAVPVTFNLVPLLPGGTTLTETATASGGGVGGSLLACATFLNVPVNLYDVSIAVGGDYYSGAGATTLAVYDPSLSATTGAGMIRVGGESIEFAVTASYKRTGELQGKLVVLRHQGGGLSQLLSTSFDSLAIVGNTAILLAQATLTDFGPVSVQALLVDNGEPGKQDQFGLKVTAPGGQVLLDWTWAPLTLTAGNVQVPRPPGR